MTADQVRELIRIESRNNLKTVGLHGISLEQMIIAPQQVRVTVRDGRSEDQEMDVWLVGRKPSNDGYSIVMSDDGLTFGLAGGGFPTDHNLVFIGWYGDLVSTFLGM